MSNSKWSSTPEPDLVERSLQEKLLLRRRSATAIDAQEIACKIMLRDNVLNSCGLQQAAEYQEQAYPQESGQLLA